MKKFIFFTMILVFSVAEETQNVGEKILEEAGLGDLWDDWEEAARSLDDAEFLIKSKRAEHIAAEREIMDQKSKNDGLVNAALHSFYDIEEEVFGDIEEKDRQNKEAMKDLDRRVKESREDTFK